MTHGGILLAWERRRRHREDRLRRLLILPLLLLAPFPAKAQSPGQPPATELCRLYPRDGAHAGCGLCGGPGWRRPDGRCALWSDVGPPDCRALRRELAEPARCRNQRDRGRRIGAQGAH